ncbi:MAG: helix-turn-helix domain-containing protein [Stappiaceae bacterium]
MNGLATNDDVPQCGPVPTISFDSREFHTSEKLDAMNDFSHNLYRYSPLSAGESVDHKEHTPELNLRAWTLGPIAAAAFTHSPLVADASANVNADFRSHVLLRIVRSGQVNARSANIRTQMVPGRIYLIRAENTLYPSEPGSSISLRIPCEAVGYDPSRHSRILSFDANDWAGRVVTSALQSLFQSLPTMTQTKARHAATMICDLVRSLITTAKLNEAGRDVWQSARANAMRSYVLDNLKEQEIGTNRLQAEFNVSRATVYRAFENDGGVLNFVRNERLKAIDRDLRQVTPRYGRVRQIAEIYGFADQSAFAKAFKRFHGIRPSEIIGAHVIDRNPMPSPTNPARDNLPKLASFWANMASGSLS